MKLEGEKPAEVMDSQVIQAADIPIKLMYPEA